MENITHQLNIDHIANPKLRVNCPLHPWKQANQICTDSHCSKNSVMCPQCLIEDDQHSKDHKPVIKSLESFVQNATEDIEKHTQGNKQVLKEIFQQQENQQLLRWHCDSDIHLKKVEDHITSQKMIIQEDIMSLEMQFKETCLKAREHIYQKLDQFYSHYREQFINHKTLVEENFKLSKRYTYYNNPNNLMAKLQSELPTNANKFVNDLQKSIENAKLMNTNKTVYTNGIKKMAQSINSMMDNLPNYLPGSNSDHMFGKIQNLCENFLKENLKMQEDYMKFSINKDFMTDFKKMNFQVLNDNKNLLSQNSQSELQLKPLKKFQLDIPITAITALSDIHLALASSHDSKLRIFESQSKRIHTIQAHSQPITQLTKIITEDKYMTTNKENLKEQSQRKVLLISASQDFSVIIWTFDYLMKQTPQVYSKLVGFSNIPMSVVDLQDSHNIVIGDNQGEVTIWDIHKQDQLFSNSKYHKQRISGISVQKKFEKFISVSEDSVICIWKLKYNGHKIEQLQCEQYIQEQFQGISSLNLSIKCPHVIFMGTKQGQIKFYDLSKQELIAETNAHSTQVLDLSLIENNISSKDTTSEFCQKMQLLSLGQNDKYIRMWKAVKVRDTQEFKFSGLKLDINISNQNFNSKSKLQILKGGAQPKLILANENLKELLVYELSF